MTIIAVRDGIMAADGLITTNNIKTGHVTKIYRLHGALYGFCGTLVSWMRAKWIIENKHTEISCNSYISDLPVDEPWLAMVLFPSHTHPWWFDYRGIFTPELALFQAVGAGCELALGAMALGATAKHAVEIACKYSATCGGPIQEERI